MNRIATRCMILLTCALLASAPSGAATPSARSAAKTPTGPQDLQAWLARLKGSFIVRLSEAGETKCRALGTGGTGSTQVCTTQQPASFVSTMNCVGIGEGPGLHCTFDELRRELPGQRDGSAGTQAPHMLLYNPLPVRALFGIDPAAGKLSVMIMDPNSAGFGALGSMRGDDVTFKGKCDVAGSRNSSPCTWTLGIHAPRDGQKIRITRSGPGSAHLFDLSRQQP